jgi:small subunit ribosomal protein S17
MSEEATNNETAVDEAAAATATAQRDEATASPDHEGETRSARKVREGMVTSAGMDKTIVVTVTDRVRHAKYNKFVLRSKKLYTHDETNDAGVGDRVRVMETRPMSKNKRWRLVEILERAR